MIKGRVAFYARSFHFRARPNPLPDSRICLEPRARAINRGTRPVISARLCRTPPRGIPKNRKGRHIPGHVPFRVACFFLFFWYHAKGISAKPELSTTMNLRSFLRLKDRLLRSREDQIRCIESEIDPMFRQLCESKRRTDLSRLKGI